MIDWKIQSRSHGCQACGKAFADKQSYFTLLVEHRHELIRQDVCAHCWEAKFSQGKENKEFISFWQGVFNQAPPAAPEAIQKESAESLLRKLTESANPEYAAASFILAVMLERKRILKVKAQNTRDGHRIIIYEHPKTGDVFSIVDPDLRLDKLVEVQRTVSHLLENGLPGGAHGTAGRPRLTGISGKIQSRGRRIGRCHHFRAIAGAGNGRPRRTPGSRGDG